MNTPDSEGLGLSMLIYAGAIVVTLTTIAVPVYYANTPQVYDNPPLAPADPLLNGPIIGDREPARHPLAILKHSVIIDPKVVAALNAKIKRAVPEPRAAEHVERRPVNVSTSERRPEPRHSTFFLFDLFGG